MSTKQSTKSVIYCRNHNYTKHFEWTYELSGMYTDAIHKQEVTKE